MSAAVRLRTRTAAARMSAATPSASAASCGVASRTSRSSAANARSSHGSSWRAITASTAASTQSAVRSARVDAAAGDRQLHPGVEHALDLRRRRGRRHQQQPPHAAPHRPLLQRLVVDDLERHAVAAVEQRRVGAHDVSGADALLDDAIERAEVPTHDVAPLPHRCRLGERRAGASTPGGHGSPPGRRRHRPGCPRRRRRRCAAAGGRAAGRGRSRPGRSADRWSRSAPPPAPR